MNYSSLATAIQDFIETTETTFVANIPVFVKAVEQRVYNEIQLPALKKNVTGALTSGNKYLSVPSDYLSVFSLAVIDVYGTYHFLLNKDSNFIREAFPYPAVTGIPSHYAIFDVDSLLLGPTPDASYSAELQYYHNPESIVTAGTTWLGDNYDTVLLYGALVEANMFIKGEPDLTTLYQTKYDTALGALKMLGDGKNRQDSYRSGQIRIPVT